MGDRTSVAGAICSPGTGEALGDAPTGGGAQCCPYKAEDTALRTPRLKATQLSLLVSQVRGDSCEVGSWALLD